MMRRRNDDADMSPETVALIKAKYGYDQPVYIQYIRWLDGLINGNFGYSIVTHQSISADLAIRIPNTIKLILPAYLLAYALAIVLGLIAGSHKNKWVDKLIDGICAIGICTAYFLGIDAFNIFPGLQTECASYRGYAYHWPGEFHD